MAMVRRKWLIILGVFVLFLTTVVLAREPILLGVGDFLIVTNNPLKPADLIHVLGGNVDRIDYGIMLYKQGYGKKMFFTGGRIAIPLVNTTYSRLSKEYAIFKGVHPDDVVSLESTATSTYEETLELKQLLENDLSVRSIIIVSSPYHLRRARWIFQKVLGGRVTFQFAPVPFEMGGFKRRWWTNELSLKTVVIEYLSLPFYYAKYHNYH